jgi:predicted CoA-binding protein
MVYDSLSALGKRVYAVGPQSGHFDGLEIYDSLRSLSEKPQAIIIGTKPEKALSVLDEVAASGADYIWLQQGCYDKHVLAMVDRMGIDAIKGCAMMYMPGTAFLHRMHRTFAELLGGGYK